MTDGARPPLARAFRRMALPLASYYGVTLVLPITNGAAHAGSAFVVHALVVLVVPLLLIASACAAHGAARALARVCGSRGNAAPFPLDLRQVSDLRSSRIPRG
jgi:hypothetical protein